MDKSTYFAQLLNEHDSKELQINENYLVELIHYLYSRDSDFSEQDLTQLCASPPSIDQKNDLQVAQRLSRQNDTHEDHDTGNDEVPVDETTQNFQHSHTTHGPISPIDTSTISGDIEILMHMLVLAKKYSFNQLYKILLDEINYKLSPLTAIRVYKCACELNLSEFRSQTRIMILSWLPSLQLREEFLTLPQGAIYDIFNAESPDIERDSKLDALSLWWSRNKNVDLTELWVKIMMSTETRR